MVDFLKARGATEQDFKAMILWAIQQGDYDTVKKLLEKGVDVNLSVPNGSCLIHFAAEKLMRKPRSLREKGVDSAILHMLKLVQFT